MLTTAHRQAQLHGRTALCVAAFLFVATTALAFASAPSGDHVHGETPGGTGEVVTLCLLGGACGAIVGMGALGIRGPGNRQLWSLPGVPTYASLRLAVSPERSARAGPPPPRMQVLRL